MSLTLRPVFTDKNPASFHFSISRTQFSKSSISPNSTRNSKTNFSNHRFFTSHYRFSPFVNNAIKASFDEPYGRQVNVSKDVDFDAFLSILEFFCLASSAATSVYVAVSSRVQKGLILGNNLLAFQCVVLVIGVVVGSVIRRRQWRRICGAELYRGSGSSSGVNLLERVEKVEDDLRSSAAIIRVLSRQLEKLGIRFRVTRKALKEPIAETAALVQKNSEATRALAAQEDNLEKELGEIQKVLMAMQEQQQKQFELILAIGKAGKMLETTKNVQSRDKNVSELSKSSMKESPKLELNNVENLALHKESNNDIKA